MPGPPTPTALTAASAVVELAVLLAAAALAPRPAAAGAAAGPEDRSDSGGSSTGSTGSSSGGGRGGAGAAAPLPPLPLGLPPAAAAGLEIGLYNCVGTFAQVGGLALTTATRGAFLVQASTLFTPVLSSWAGMAPSRCGGRAGRHASPAAGRWQRRVRGAERPPAARAEQGLLLPALHAADP